MTDAMVTEAGRETTAFCGTHCPLEGGDTQATNPCPLMDHCATRRDEERFDAALAPPAPPDAGVT